MISKEALVKIKEKEAKKGNVVTVVNGKLKVALECKDETMTQQQYKKEQDIKEIIKKYGATGLLNKNIMANDPKFDDVSHIIDYQDAANKIAKAQQEFDQMPHELKEKFNYNPAKLLDYLNKSENLQEAIELGLVNKQMTPDKSEELKVLEDIASKMVNSSSSVE